MTDIGVIGIVRPWLFIQLLLHMSGTALLVAFLTKFPLQILVGPDKSDQTSVLPQDVYHCCMEALEAQTYQASNIPDIVILCRGLVLTPFKIG
jgi:hypothetical protein